MTPLDGHPTESRVGLDQVFTALSHTTRRRILATLMDDNPRRTEEFETLEFAPADDGPETITLELHHRHLPKLDEAGFIDWDRGTGRVVRGEHFAEIRPLLELMDDHRDELPDDWP